MVTLENIKEARKNLKGIIKKTSLDHSKTFSELSKNDIYLKLENLQKTGSFKVRGASNKIAKLTEEEKKSGVVAASAGNHAQGVALAASKAGIKSTIVMPKGAPIAKVKATKGYGADVILHGNSYDEAHERELEFSRETGATIIHAFDDLDVIAGQGTIGLEILEDLPDVDVVVAPIGGGGLLSGIAVAVKSINPSIQVIGVQAAEAASMKESIKSGKPITLSSVDTIADGIAVKRPGNSTFDIISKYVDGIVTVNEEEIAHTISLLIERAKLTVEGAGATALAAVINDKVSFQGKKIAVVLSGGNIDLDMISSIIDRGMVKGGRRLVITTSLPDSPGALQKILCVIGDTGANVISVNHDRTSSDITYKQAEVKFVLGTKDHEHIEKIIEVIKNNGYKIKKIR
ncbi:threonine ammonia-lyase [Clostridium sediminicola]|uniref:threonine ammonia-lyase n=1 Tax=Clostridium sediminicola TaxID=3114879 RepID=UPI0031F26214